jgi:parvulin-like peptidyl-prolyl isomerase
MPRKALVVLAVMLALVACLIWGCGKKEGDVVVARVGRVNITDAQLRQRLGELPEFAQRQFSGPQGTIDFLTNLVEEEVLYQAARQAGYEKDPEILSMLEAVKRRSMIQAYYRDEIEGKLEIPEEDIVAYYNEHEEAFRQPARIKFRHIMTATQDAAREARRRVLGGEVFDSVAREVSIDAATKDAGGLRASVYLGDSVPELGMDPAFIERLFGWKVGETTEPLRSSKGWHVVRVEEKQEAGKKPLDEIRDQIVSTMKPAKARERYAAVLESLKAKYKATINEDAYRENLPTEEELFTRAQQTNDAAARLDLYLQLVMSYPEGGYADDAQFMIGFIQSEELRDYEAARNAFQRLLDKYPNSELAESARWMIENMGKEAPPFTESGRAETEK